VPAAGFWGMRAWMKRVFLMMNERGMLPLVLPHMTSFSPLPTLSFSSMEVDWEWKYGLGDVQDRFPREYILLAADGELAGTWPVVLHDHGAQINDPWVQRTFAAVRLVHELDGMGGWDDRNDAQRENQRVGKPVLAMLDKPGLKVYRYWDERPQPVVATQPDLIPTIVYSVPGKEAVAVAVSYSQKDENVTLKVDPAALGFAGGYTVVNAETGDAVTVDHDQIALPLKKHDLVVLRFTAGGDK
jgi:hypothetical protein